MVIKTHGLTDAEQKAIDDKLKSFYSENSIGTIYSAYYSGFTKSIMKKSNAEAQIELNKWKARGLNSSFLQTIAKNIANKDLSA